MFFLCAYLVKSEARGRRERLVLALTLRGGGVVLTKTVAGYPDDIPGKYSSMSKLLHHTQRLIQARGGRLQSALPGVHDITTYTRLSRDYLLYTTMNILEVLGTAILAGIQILQQC